MFKRILMVFILAVGVLALRSGVVDAHLAGYTYSPTARHVSSYEILGHFKQIPDLRTHPAIFETILEVQEVVVYCVNPKGKFVDGIPTGPWPDVSDETPINESDLDKKKGRANPSVHIESDEDLPWWDDTICSDRNLLWTVGDELITEMIVHLWTYDCATSECNVLERVPAFHAELGCKLPPGADRTKVFDYDCGELILEEHCDQDPNACQIYP